MDDNDDQAFRRPTKERPGTDERLEIYRRRYANHLPIDMNGDLKLDDILRNESLQNSTCLFHRDEEISELIDFSNRPKNAETSRMISEVKDDKPFDLGSDLPCPDVLNSDEPGAKST